jgi:hypothetical protein
MLEGVAGAGNPNTPPTVRPDIFKCRNPNDPCISALRARRIKPNLKRTGRPDVIGIEKGEPRGFRVPDAEISGGRRAEIVFVAYNADALIGEAAHGLGGAVIDDDHLEP